MKVALPLSFLTVMACVTARPSPEAAYANQLCADGLTRIEPSSGEALAYCNRALALFPQYSDAWANRGRLLFRQGNRRDAQASFEAALRYDSRNHAAAEGLGAVALAEGRLADAISFLKKAVYLSPDEPKARYELAVALYFSGQKERAKQEALALVARLPTYPQGFHFVAVLFLEEDAPEQATPFALRALELDPKQSSHWLALAASYERLGRREDAEYALKSCLEIHPTRPECREGLSSLKASQSPLTVKLELPPP